MSIFFFIVLSKILVFEKILNRQLFLKIIKIIKIIIGNNKKIIFFLFGEFIIENKIRFKRMEINLLKFIL